MSGRPLSGYKYKYASECKQCFQEARKQRTQVKFGAVSRGRGQGTSPRATHSGVPSTRRPREHHASPLPALPFPYSVRDDPRFQRTQGARGTPINVMQCAPCTSAESGSASGGHSSLGLQALIGPAQIIIGYSILEYALRGRWPCAYCQSVTGHPPPVSVSNSIMPLD